MPGFLKYHFVQSFKHANILVPGLYFPHHFSVAKMNSLYVAFESFKIFFI
jgi:hypothetical protein